MTELIPCPRQPTAVYGPVCARVKQFVLFALAALAVTGCAPAKPVFQPVAQVPPPPAGIWYSVELAARAPAGLRETLQRDFANLATMGLDLVLIEHCPPADVAAVVEAASAHPFRLIIADPVAQRFVRTGWRRSGWFAPPVVLPQRGAVAARYIGRAVDDETLQRALRLAELAKTASPPLPLALEVDAQLAHRVPAGAFAYTLWREAPSGSAKRPPTEAQLRNGIRTVACTRAGGGEQHAVRAWLAEYHLGLANGQNGGVVFDTYRALPASPRGVVLSGEALSPERMAIVRRIADRCRSWRPLLVDLSVHQAKDISVREVDVRVAILSNSRRQCLLVVNPSADRFARGQLTLNAGMADTAFQRAVSVATTENTMAAAVHHVSGNRLDIPIAIAPGEAELFELF